MSSDDDLFKQEMGDVIPIKQDCAQLDKKSDKSASLALRRESAENEKIDENYLSSTVVKELDPYEIVSFKRPGIQHGVFKQLRLGKYQCDARLDLHRMTVEQARKNVYEFIQECVSHDLRTVMILHGKSDKNPDRKAVIKSHAVFWLEQMPEVMAFHSAQQHHGGTGALYVLLKKSEKLKSTNQKKYGVDR